MGSDWTISYRKSVRKFVERLNPRERQRIHDFLEVRLLEYPNVRAIGKALQDQSSKHWRYRVGDYRIVCEIHDGELVVLVIEIDHRSKIYK